MTGIIALTGPLAAREATMIKAVVAGLTPVFKRQIDALQAKNQSLETRVAELEAHLLQGPASSELIRTAVEQAVRQLPLPKDGKSVDAAEIHTMVVEAVSALPQPKDGESVDLDHVRGMVADAVAALPPPKDGKSIDVVEVRSMVAEAVSALPPPPGIDMAAIESSLAQLVDAAVNRLPRAKDGLGLSGALISREGTLVLTLSDGTLVELGCVVGRDADMEELRTLIKREVDAIPRPKDGKDGISLKDLDVRPAGDGRSVILSFAREGATDEFELKFPVPIYRGVWREKDEPGTPMEYEPGDLVTWGGSLWHCDEKTSAKPDTGPWRLAVKKGRDGKDFSK